MTDAIRPELIIALVAICPLIVAWAIAPLDEHKGRHQARARGWPSARTRTGTAPAPMRPDVILCGHMFGLRTRRHRWFELHGFGCLTPPHIHRPGVLTATSRRRERWAAGWDVSVTGDVGVYVGPGALGIDWMNGDELSQAIPPAYTEYIGRQLMEHLSATGAAS